MKASPIPKGRLQSGQLLMTKDGRRCGNAIVIRFLGVEILGTIEIDLYEIEEENGTVFKMAVSDILHNYFVTDNGFAKVADYLEWADQRRRNIRNNTRNISKLFTEEVRATNPDLFPEESSAPSTEPAQPPQVLQDVAAACASSADEEPE